MSSNEGVSEVSESIKNRHGGATQESTPEIKSRSG